MSAVAYHNNTVKPVAHLPLSAPALEQLTAWESESSDVGFTDPLDFKYPVKPPPTSLADHIRGMIAAWFPPREEPHPDNAQRPSDASAQIFCDLFKDVNAQSSPRMQDVGLAVPMWFTHHHVELLHDAAECAGLRLRDWSHYALATLGAERDVTLCRIPSEYLPCDAAPLVGIELSASRVTIAYYPVGGGVKSTIPWAFETSESLGQRLQETTPPSEELVSETRAWIDEFVSKYRVDKLYLLGDQAGNAGLHQAASRSIAADKLQKVRMDVVTEGMAKLVKGRMEEQSTDCDEPSSCEALRDEADRIAGANPDFAHEEL